MYRGLIAAKQETDSINPGFRPKLFLAQAIFFEQDTTFNQPYFNYCNELLNTALYRYDASAITLEFFHSIRNTKDFCKHRINNLVPSKDSDLFLHQVLLDQYLLLSSAFMEFYFKYVYFFCFGKKAKRNKIKDIIDTFKDSTDNKSQLLYDYFVTTVYKKEESDPDLWGNKLRRLRNLTAHEKLVKLENIQRTSLLGQTREDVAFEGEQIGLFLQTTFDNNMFRMITDLNPILYCLPWVPGEFHENIYG